MKILNEKMIKKQSFVYDLLVEKRETLKGALSQYIEKIDDVVFKVNNSNCDLVMQFPRDKSRLIKYGTYYIGVDFKPNTEKKVIVKYVVDDEELYQEDLNKLNSIIDILYNNFKDYDVDKFNEINKLEN
jgi:hypothetical protein